MDPAVADSTWVDPSATGHGGGEWKPADGAYDDLLWVSDELKQTEWTDGWDPANDNTVGDMDPSEAIRLLSHKLTHKWQAGDWWATDICEIAFYCKAAGLGGSVAELAKRPGLDSGKYSDHVKKVTGFNADPEMYEYLQAPGRDKRDGSRTLLKIPVRNPHECLQQEIVEDQTLVDKHAEHVEQGLLPPIYTEHMVAVSSGLKAQGGGSVCGRSSND